MKLILDKKSLSGASMSNNSLNNLCSNFVSIEKNGRQTNFETWDAILIEILIPPYNLYANLR